MVSRHLMFLSIGALFVIGLTQIEQKKEKLDLKGRYYSVFNPIKLSHSLFVRLIPYQGDF